MTAIKNESLSQPSNEVALAEVLTKLSQLIVSLENRVQESRDCVPCRCRCKSTDTPVKSSAQLQAENLNKTAKACQIKIPSAHAVGTVKQPPTTPPPSPTSNAPASQNLRSTYALDVLTPEEIEMWMYFENEGVKYLVTKGKEPGVYNTWEEAGPLVLKVSGAVHVSVSSKAEAVRRYKAAWKRGQVQRLH